MKAKEYFEKYEHLIYEDIREQSTTNTFNLLKELLSEALYLANQRRIVRVEALVSIINETNNKWNSICSMYEKKYGASPLKWNGFKAFVKHEMPDLAPLLERR